MDQFPAAGPSLIIATTEQCSDMIDTWDDQEINLPSSLKLRHLDWMCSKVAAEVEHWPTHRLHRWVEFILRGMITHGLLRLEDAETMFDEATKRRPIFAESPQLDINVDTQPEFPWRSRD